MRYLIFTLIMLIPQVAFAYPLSPRSSTGLTASQDVLASSSDTHSVGTTSNFWRNLTTRNVVMAHGSPTCVDTSSFACLYVSGDSLIFRKSTGSETTVVA